MRDAAELEARAHGEGLAAAGLSIGQHRGIVPETRDEQVKLPDETISKSVNLKSYIKSSFIRY